MKPLSELTLLDRFLFASAMENRKTMELVLRIILQQDITLLDQVQAEKEIRTAPWLRSIRLDIISTDGVNVYDAEVQKTDTKNLPRRSRYYQALIDSSLLPPGEIDFNRMQDACLIIIAPFDLFGEKRYRYTFQMKCRESDTLWLEDGATRIFFNTRGKNPEEENPEVIELLKYFEHTDETTVSQCISPRIHQLHDQVSRIKSSEEMGVKYMQEWEEKAYARLEGREEGLAEGLAEGREEGLKKGLEEGRSESKRQAAANMFSMNMPLEDIGKILEVPVETIRNWLEEWKQTL